MSEEKKIILVMGIRGTGKSTKVKELLSLRNRILIYDTLGEYNNGVIFTEFNDLVNYWLKVYHKKFRIIYQPLNPVEDFSSICELVFECGNVCFSVEEIDTFLSLNPSGLDANFLNIVQRGRHREIELIGVTQRPYAIPAILRSQCKEIYSFRQFEQRDIDWLKGIMGNEAEGIRDLEQFEYLYYNGSINKGKTRKV